MECNEMEGAEGEHRNSNGSTPETEMDEAEGEHRDSNGSTPETSHSAQKLDYAKICIICQKEMSPVNSRAMGEKAKNTITEASKRRKDMKYKLIQTLQRFKLHTSCQTMYIRPSSIEEAGNKNNQYRAAMRENFKLVKSFDYDSKCFICEKLWINRDVEKRKKCFVTLETVQCMREELQSKTLNDEEKLLLLRLDNIEKSFQKVNAFYHLPCYKKFYRYKSKNNVGRPISKDISDVLDFTINYILNHEEECQFSLQEILKSYSGSTDISFRMIKLHLTSHFGDEVTFYSFKGDLHICFRAMYNNTLNDEWYLKKKATDEEERMRIVQMAANIIVQDVRGCHYDISNYKDPNSFLKNAKDEIPPTLLSFLEILVKSHKVLNNKNYVNKWDNRILTYSHILISSIRPRSFLSSILLGLSSMMHRKHASRSLLDCLSNLGLCCTYHDTCLFEASIVKNPTNFEISIDSFVQCIFDNADHNTVTLDGRNTFHAMGGIMAVTPASAVRTSSTIKKLKINPTSNEIAESFSFLPISLVDFELSGLKTMKVKKIDYSKSSIDISYLDFRWLFEKSKYPLETKGWLGYREAHSDITEFCVSKNDTTEIC